MIFMLVYMFLFFGIFLAGFAGLMPIEIQVMIPPFFRVILFFMGFMIAFIGIFILQGRASKTGAGHLLEFGRPGSIIWIYAHRDGTLKITPSIREVEGQLYCKELDAQIHDLKSYRLFDHSIRFVPEGVGHSVDLDMCLYAGLLKIKYGFSNLREARTAGFRLFGHPKTKPITSHEHISGEITDDNE